MSEQKNNNGSMKPKSLSKGEQKKSDLNSIHKRVIHRLQTARVTVWGGVSCIVILAIVGMIMGPFITDEKITTIVYEILRTTITTLATIITLALGYIAGSNIESSGNL